MANSYLAVVVCEIDPTSTANYCRVFARDGTITVDSKLLLHIHMYMHICIYIYHVRIYRSSKEICCFKYFMNSDEEQKIFAQNFFVKLIFFIVILAIQAI